MNSDQRDTATNGEAECSVCMEAYDQDQREAVILPCFHSICSTCLPDLIKSKPKCPLCNALFDPEQSLQFIRQAKESRVKQQRQSQSNPFANQRNLSNQINSFSREIESPQQQIDPMRVQQQTTSSTKRERVKIRHPLQIDSPQQINSSSFGSSSRLLNSSRNSNVRPFTFNQSFVSKVKTQPQIEFFKCSTSGKNRNQFCSDCNKLFCEEFAERVHGRDEPCHQAQTNLHPMTSIDKSQENILQLFSNDSHLLNQETLKFLKWLMENQAPIFKTLKSMIESRNARQSHLDDSTEQNLESYMERQRTTLFDLLTFVQQGFNHQLYIMGNLKQYYTFVAQQMQGFSQRHLQLPEGLPARQNSCIVSRPNTQSFKAQEVQSILADYNANHKAIDTEDQRKADVAEWYMKRIKECIPHERKGVIQQTDQISLLPSVSHYEQYVAQNFPNIGYQELRFPAQFAQSQVLLLPLYPDKKESEQNKADFSLIFESQFPIIQIDLLAFSHGIRQRQIQIQDPNQCAELFQQEHGQFSYIRQTVQFKKRESFIVQVLSKQKILEPHILFYDYFTEYVNQNGHQQVNFGVIDPNGQLMCYFEFQYQDHIESISVAGDSRGRGTFYRLVTSGENIGALKTHVYSDNIFNYMHNDDWESKHKVISRQGDPSETLQLSSPLVGGQTEFILGKHQCFLLILSQTNNSRSVIEVIELSMQNEREFLNKFPFELKLPMTPNHERIEVIKFDEKSSTLNLVLRLQESGANINFSFEPRSQVLKYFQVNLNLNSGLIDLWDKTQAWFGDRSAKYAKKDEWILDYPILSITDPSEIETLVIQNYLTPIREDVEKALDIRTSLKDTLSFFLHGYIQEQNAGSQTLGTIRLWNIRCCNELWDPKLNNQGEFLSIGNQALVEEIAHESEYSRKLRETRSKNLRINTQK